MYKAWNFNEYLSGFASKLFISVVKWVPWSELGHERKLKWEIILVPIFLNWWIDVPTWIVPSPPKEHANNILKGDISLEVKVI